MTSNSFQTKYSKISPKEVKTLMENTEDLVIVDVRTEKEFLYQGRLLKSILIDFSKPRIFKKEIEKLDKSKPILIYCATGKLSSKSCNTLVELGFEKIYEMVGGLKSWQEDLDLVCTVSKLNDKEVIEARKKIIVRLNKIEGQIKGVKKMLLDGEYCGDILNQSLAIKSALNGANLEIMEMFSNLCLDDTKENKEDFFKYMKKLMS